MSWRRIAPPAFGVFLLVLAQGCGGATASPAAGLDSGTDGAAAALDAGGDAPAVIAVTCVPDAGASTAGPGDPAVPDVVSGTNGAFSDACDAQGNLVDYSCETTSACGPGPNPDCTTYLTGRVVPQSVDCSGHCSGARCDSRCPVAGQRFHYAAVGAAGAATLVNDSDGRTYACTVLFDSPSDTYDCTTGPAAGVAGTITSLGLHGSWCTGKSFGNIGVAIDGVPSPQNESCAYGCDIP